MKKLHPATFLSLFFLSLFGLLAVSKANAQSATAQSGVSLRVHAGSAFPVSPQDFSEYYSLGSDAGVGVAVPLSSRLTLTVDASHNYFGANYESFAMMSRRLGGVQIQAQGESVHIFSGAAGLRYTFEGRTVRPYLAAAAGMNHYLIEDTGGREGVSDGPAMGLDRQANRTSFLVNAGGGLRVAALDQVDIFIESLFTYSSRGPAYMPMRAGLVFGL